MPPNFEILVVFALSLLRALLRKMSGEKGVGGKGGRREDVNDENDGEEKDPEDDERGRRGSSAPNAGLSKQRRAILEGIVPLMVRCPVSYTHLTLPTILLV